MNDPTRVEWREWGSDAFTEASEAEVPVLLSLTATWCDHCHEMDEETHAEPRIAANINDRFVPIRVDVDRRPRIRDRYNMGGFPSTVFLTPDGSLLTGAGYLGPDGMRQVLESVGTMWETKGADAGRIPRPLQEEQPPSGTLSSDVEGTILAQLSETYDEIAGGWGTEPKFPLPDALEFALKRDREMSLRSFEAVSANLLDEYEGGFYRFASNSDWGGIHHEKLLDSNAALVRAFSNAYLYTGEENYRNPAKRTIEYLTTTLWNDDADAFANSQAPGDPGSYTLEASDREASEEPPVDTGVFAGPNGLAIEGLLTFVAYTDDERARRYAERALETVRTDLLEDGVVSHRLTDDRDERIEPGPLLLTQARTLRALATAASVLGAETLSEARAVADVTVDRLRDGDSCIDAPSNGAGLLERPLRPLDANVAFADALVDLAVMNESARYRTIAREILEDFAGASDRFGVQIAKYGSVAARLLEDPLVVRVGTDAGTDLHRAALRVADHEKTVVPNATGELEAGTARVERGDRITEPATTPEELSERVGSVLD